MSRRYAVAAMAEIEGRAGSGSVFLGLIGNERLCLTYEDAVELAASANARQQQIWPDSSVRHRIFVLAEVPEMADTPGSSVDDFVDHYCRSLERLFAQRSALTENTL